MPQSTVVIEGHTDSVGKSAAIEKLSLARAESVLDFLVKQEHLSAASMTAKGYGATRPIATNATAEGREKNRRVEIIVVPKQGGQGRTAGNRRCDPRRGGGGCPSNWASARWAQEERSSVS
jgi:hypothetical protein